MFKNWSIDHTMITVFASILLFVSLGLYNAYREDVRYADNLARMYDHCMADGNKEYDCWSKIYTKRVR